MLTASEIERMRKKLQRDQERADKEARDKKAFTGWMKKKKSKYWVNPAKLMAKI